MRTFIWAKLRSAIGPDWFLMRGLRVCSGSGTAPRPTGSAAVELGIEFLNVLAVRSQPTRISEAVSHSSRDPKLG